MKTVFVTRKFPPSVGGMERFAYDLHRSIAKNVRTFLVKWGGGNVWLPAVIPYLFLRSLWITVVRRVDVIHIQDGVLAPVGYLLSLLTGKPWVIVIHGLDITYKNKLFKAVNLRCIRKAGKVFCISQSTAEEALERGVSGQKIQVMPLGITDEHGIARPAARKLLSGWLDLNPDEHKLLLTSGRLVQRKGVAWFIESVMPGLIKLMPEVLYLVVGDGGQRENIEKAIRRQGLERNVHMLGKVSDAKLGALYRGSDVFVMPNIKIPGDVEGFGRVAIEASVCELPVVASGIEGILDAIKDGRNGVLVPERAVKAFEKEIARLAGNAKAARSFAEKSRQYTLKHYEWDAIAKRYIAGYEQVLQ